MTVFTDAERAFLLSQPLARIATSSAGGVPDVSPVAFALAGDTIVTGGFDITRTVRYRNLLANPLAAIVIDDLPSRDPWTPRGVKVRGSAAVEEHRAGLRIRITPAVVWTWGINAEPDEGFHGVVRRTVG